MMMIGKTEVMLSSVHLGYQEAIPSTFTFPSFALGFCFSNSHKYINCSKLESSDHFTNQYCILPIRSFCSQLDIYCESYPLKSIYIYMIKLSKWFLVVHPEYFGLIYYFALSCLLLKKLRERKQCWEANSFSSHSYRRCNNPKQGW